MAGLTDFNDLHVLHGNEKGLLVVRSQIVDAVERFRGGVELSPEKDAAERELVQGGEPSGLQSLLQRYFLIYPSGMVWDVKEQVQLTRAAFKLHVGKDLNQQWQEHSERQEIKLAEVRFIENQKREAFKRAALKADWHAQFIKTDAGKIQDNIANAMLVLSHDFRWQGVIGYCEFSYRIIKRKAPPFKGGGMGEWTDTDTDRLRIWLYEHYEFSPKTSDAHGAVTVAAEENKFHPVREYLEGLRWDGNKRVATWLHKYLGASLNEYTALVGSMWLVSAVARVVRPPVKVDSVLIFEGLQGLGKSTALSILAGEWFTDTPLVLGEKDSFQQMQGVWIIELAELDSLNKAESTRAKQFFGSQTDRYRPSYGRMVQTFARQCVFAGSTNQDAYLKDSTGNRRYWPVSCTKIDASQLQADRDQLWAEAYHLFNAGFKWWPQDTHKHLFEGEQEARFDSDVWEELIVAWLKTHTREVVLMSEIMEEALKMQAAQMKPPEQKRIGQIMAHIKWERTRPRVNGGRETGYKRPVAWIAASAANSAASGFVPVDEEAF